VFAEYRPDIVINAAAYTQVDRAESEQELAYAVNRDAVMHLSQACDSISIPMLQVSTDYVFAGDRSDPYLEDDDTAPLGVYGESKLAGEDIIGSSLARHIILRTSWVFSATGRIQSRVDRTDCANQGRYLEVVGARNYATPGCRIYYEDTMHL
jgi:dTDP-4-dehydrorhamnose reductase